jgi:hypothetical protein
MPIIALSSTISDGIHYPEFKITGWALWDGKPAAPVVPVPIAQPAPPAPKAAEGKVKLKVVNDFDLDDEVPF